MTTISDLKELNEKLLGDLQAEIGKVENDSSMDPNFKTFYLKDLRERETIVKETLEFLKGGNI